MGFGTYSAFTIAYEAAQDASARGGQRAARAERTAETLEARCDRLAMLCEAMWTLLRDQTGLNDEQLIDRINEIDLSDGTLDGKVDKSSGPIRCHQCDRAVGARFAKCMYCGAPVARDPFT